MPRDQDREPTNPADRADAHPDGAESPAGFEDAQERMESLRAEVADLNAKYLRTLADYHNSQRRAAGNEREAKQQGAASVIQNVLTVLDHFDLALGQDASKASAEQILSGVRVIRDELMKVLQNHGIGLIAPKPGDEFDPTRHQAMMQEIRPGVEPGRVVAVFQTGYTLADRVIRPAMVTVSRAAD
ncbi:MAG: nucleotide exchange factor GrpE [Phycisphaerales bacterium]